jgi:hypothetical protein
LAVPQLVAGRSIRGVNVAALASVERVAASGVHGSVTSARRTKEVEGVLEGLPVLKAPKVSDSHKEGDTTEGTKEETSSDIATVSLGRGIALAADSRAISARVTLVAKAPCLADRGIVVADTLTSAKVACSTPTGWDTERAFLRATSPRVNHHMVPASHILNDRILAGQQTTSVRADKVDAGGARDQALGGGGARITVRVENRDTVARVPRESLHLTVGSAVTKTMADIIAAGGVLADLESRGRTGLALQGKAERARGRKQK